MTETTRTYTKRGDGWIDGCFHADGAYVRMTPRQAFYHLISGQVVDEATPSAPAPAEDTDD